jgi:protein TonB
MGWIDKKPKKDLRKHYTIIFEGALAVALVVMLTAFNIEIRDEPEDQKLIEEQETVDVEEIQRTKQVEKPPPPPRPPVPVEVPNDEVIEDEIVNLDADLNMNEELDMPPPPPPKEEDDKEDEVFVVAEKMPKLQGGMRSINKKIQYPELARKAGVEGRVIVQFVVNERGQVVNPKVIRGIGAGCDKEALRVVKQAEFSPGVQRGKPVKVQMTLPIVFQLQN